jgi:hypothetical protein
MEISNITNAYIQQINEFTYANLKIRKFDQASNLSD